MDNNVSQSVLSKQPRKEGKKLLQYFIAIAANLTIFVVGINLAWTSPALSQLQSPNSSMPVTPEEGSWIGSLVAVGAFLGALPTGPASDLFGRKLTLLATGIPFLISWVLIAYSSSVHMLYIARFIAGFATGSASAIVPVYVGEIAETSVRGALGTFFQIMTGAGVLYAYVVGALVNFYWLAVLCGLIPVLFIILFINAPETPLYLLRKGRRSDAQKVLRLLRGSEYNVHSEINEIQRELDRKSQTKVSFSKVLCKKSTIKSLIISLGLMIFQQWSGINAVTFYANSIFKSSGSSLDPSVCSIILGAIQVTSAYVGMMFVDRAGRRVLLIFSYSVMAICHCLLGYYFHLQQKGENINNLGLIPLVSLGVYIIAFSTGAGPIPWMMAGEIFSSEIKGVASSVAASLSWTQTFLVTKLFQSIVDTIGPDYTFWVLAGICIAGTIFSIILVIETKGKTFEQIQNELEGRPSLPKQNDNL